MHKMDINYSIIQYDIDEMSYCAFAITKWRTSNIGFCTRVQFEQSPLQWHLTSSWLILETSGILIQTGTHILENLVQENASYEGIIYCACACTSVPNSCLIQLRVNNREESVSECSVGLRKMSV